VWRSLSYSSDSRRIIPLHLDEALKVLAKLIANAPKSRQPILVGSLHSGGVIETPMDAQGVGGENGAALSGLVADGNHKVKRLPGELVHRFRPLAGDINPDFTHCGDGFRANGARLCAGARNLKRSASIVPKQPFRHLAPGRISGAEDQNSHALPPFPGNSNFCG
jgi:hypothetical protein